MSHRREVAVLGTVCGRLAKIAWRPHPRGTQVILEVKPEHSSPFIMLGLISFGCTGCLNSTLDYCISRMWL